MSSILLVILGILKSVWYKIGNESLVVKNIFQTKFIKISSIQKITQVSTILSSPFATSYDRLEIFYNKFDSVMVSPQDKKHFIAELLKINPNIVVEV